MSETRTKVLTELIGELYGLVDGTSDERRELMDKLHSLTRMVEEGAVAGAGAATMVLTDRLLAAKRQRMKELVNALGEP